MYPIELQSHPVAWRQKIARESDSNFRNFQSKVFLRDNFTCQFCGFQAREFQDIINLDYNYRNNKISNMVTACCFCSQCFFLESVGAGDYGGGTLIYLPELTQPELNSLCHVLFCAISNDTGYKTTAQSVYRSLKFRSQLIEEKFGEGASNPSAFGQLLIECSVSKDVARNILSNIRLLPSRSKFKKQIENWASHALNELAAAF